MSFSRVLTFVPVNGGGVLLIVAIALVLSTGCVERKPESTDPEIVAWRAVLAEKRRLKETRGPSESAAKQRYADKLAEFVKRYPAHKRARQVYLEAEVEFAQALSGAGRYAEAIPYFENVVRSDPQNRAARTGLLDARRKKDVSDEEMKALFRGMTRDEVRALLGQPAPGWETRKRRGPTLAEAWYYKRVRKGLATVFFVDGKVVAIELGEEKAGPEH